MSELTISRGRRVARSLGLESAGRILRDFATYLPTQAAPAIAGVIGLVAVARVLDRNALGVLGIMQTLVSLGGSAIAQWCTAAIVRELPAASAADDMHAFRRTLTRALLLIAAGLAVFALLLVGGSFVSRALAGNALLVVAATVGLSVQNVAVSLFAASLRPRAYAIVEAGSRVGGIALGVVLVFQHHGVGGYLAGLAIVSLAIGSAGLVFAWPRHPQRQSDVAPAHPTLRRWIHYGIPVSAAATFAWALSFIDRYLIAAIKNVDQAGVYFMGNALGDRLVMVPMFAFAAAANPLLVTAFEHHGRAEVERLLRAYTRVILLVSIPCVGYVYAAAWPLVKIFAGLNYFRYAQATTVAPLVAIGSLLYGLGGLAAVGLAVQRKMRYLILSTAVGLVVNVVANLILIPLYGVVGAAIATPISTGAYLAATAWWSHPYATWRFPFSTFARAVVATLVGIVVVRFALHHFHWQFVQVLVAAGVGAVVYPAVLLVLGERAHGRAAGLSPLGDREHVPSVEKP